MLPLLVATAPQRTASKGIGCCLESVFPNQQINESLKVKGYKRSLNILSRIRIRMIPTRVFYSPHLHGVLN